MNNWQDIIFGIGGFVFAAALIPSIKSMNKPSAITSLITAFFLSLYCVCFATLGLWLGFASGVLSAGAWWILCIQKWRINIMKGYGQIK